MRTQPDMELVKQAVRRLCPTQAVNSATRTFEPIRKQAQDVALRKTVSVIRKGCSGFNHPHFHQ